MTSTTEEKPGTWQIIKSYAPILDWLPGYQRVWLRADAIAALTVWAMLVPEAMAYAALAGLPPEAGLYAAPLAMLGYAIFGSSRQLVVGPSSTVAAMSAVIIAPLAAGDTERYIILSATLAMLMGIYLIIAGLLKLGFLANFMSKPVLSGFVVGVALTIVAGQLDKLVGYQVPEGGFFVELLYFVLDIENMHLPTLVVGLTSLALLFVLHRYAPKVPAALVVVALSILAVTIFDLEEKGVHVVGDIPAGLPPLGLPGGISLSSIGPLSLAGLAIGLVAFAESVAAARTYASKHGYEVDANQELIGLGAASMGAGFSQGFVVDGSLSRTAAADGAGQRTQMASLINIGLVLITVVALTPLFHNLAEATLGAIVIHAVWHLIDFSDLRAFYTIRTADFLASLVALLGVVSIGILGGLVLAVLLSLFALLARVSAPRTAILGRVPGRTTYRDLAQFPDSDTFPGLIIFRFDEQLFFANATIFRDRLREAVAAADPPARTVLVDAESINDIDITGMDMLQGLIDELAGSGIDLRFSRVKTPVMEVMRRTSLADAIGEDHFYLTVSGGVDAYLAEQGMR